LRDALNNSRDDEPIGNKLALLHEWLRLPADGCLRSNCSAQHIARREVRNSQLLRNADGLCPLARSRRSQQNNSHDEAPSVRPVARNHMPRQVYVLQRAMASMISSQASEASPQPLSFTHLPGSRSL